MDQTNPATDLGQAQSATGEAQAEWLKYPDAERYCGLSRVTLWRAAKRGELEIIRVGRAVIISRRELDRFIQSHAEEVTR
jgi:excisionase family DNA binding protein